MVLSIFSYLYTPYTIKEKIMKRNILSFLFVMCTVIGYAQIKLSVQGGAGMSTITKASDYSPKVGYRFGVGLEFPLSHEWALQTGVQVLNRNYHLDEVYKGVMADGNKETALALEADESINAIYLQIPVKAVYTLPLFKQSALRFSGGLYAAYGIAGKFHSTSDLYSSSKIDVEDLIFNCIYIPQTPTHITIKTNGNTFWKDGLNRFDMGIYLGADYSYKNIFAGVGFEYGILPISDNFTNNPLSAMLGEPANLSPRNIGLELHIGYSF